ncbi:MAG: hypothetical protein IKT42_06360 [Clostridia bacterium]|nr:hypothetical protein [Clostridia bacterium]
MNLITIQTLADGNKIRSFLNYETSDAAVGALYSALASAVANTDIVQVICMVMDDEGRCKKYESWVREPLQEPDGVRT